MVTAAKKKLSVKQRRSRENLKPFKKGQSGNPKGRPPKEFCIPDILRDQGNLITDKRTKKTFYEKMCLIAWEQASKGDHQARTWISDRLEGKPAQSLNMNVNTQRPKFDGKNPQKFLNKYINYQNNLDN
jgi:hypothetical protein